MKCSHLNLDHLNYVLVKSEQNIMWMTLCSLLVFRKTVNCLDSRTQLQLLEEYK